MIKILEKSFIIFAVIYSNYWLFYNAYRGIIKKDTTSAFEPLYAFRKSGKKSSLVLGIMSLILAIIELPITYWLISMALSI